MAKDDTIKWIVVAVVAYFVLGGGLGGDDDDVPPPPPPASCPYEPTIEFQAVDKFNSGFGAYRNAATTYDVKYMLNGGSPVQWDGNDLGVQLGDSLKVLWSAENQSHFNRASDTYTISECGHQIISKKLLRNNTVTLQCYNEQGNLIGGSTGAVTGNLTLGTGAAETINCEIKGDTERGWSNGAVMIVAVNGTAFDEGAFSMSGDIIEGVTSVPVAYSNTGDQAAKLLAWDLGNYEGPHTDSFTFYVKAESAQNPGQNAAEGYSINMTIYQKDCYENTETGEFLCGITKEEDGTFVKDWKADEFELCIA